jgi:hypothetical protein
MRSWLRGLWNLVSGRPEAWRVPRRRPGRLSVEALEDRWAPAVYAVLGTADNNNPVITAGHAGTAADPFLAPSLRSAITAANANPGGNTIELTVGGTYKTTLVGTPGETDNLAGEFAILPTGGDLTIVNTSGLAVAVEGNHLNRVFDINPGNTDNPATKVLVTFQGFTIQNGVAFDAGNPDGPNASGGGIRDQGNTSLTLTNVVLTNNVASADGGGVSMENAPASTPWTLTLNNTIVSNNHAGDAGGGVETDGKGKVFINGGALTGNTTVNQGAAVWLDAVADGVTTVTVNTGGAGYTSAPMVTFSAPQNAGGTTATGFATVVNGVVTAVTITNPGSGYTTAPTITFSGGGATTQATAAAVLGFNNSANLTISGTTVSNNSALNGPTGAIGNAGAGAVVISNSTVENNYSGTTGGGFGDENNLGTLTVTNSVFLNNTALTDGGGIQEGGASTTITNSVIQGNYSGGLGGGVVTEGGALSILDSTILGNTSAKFGGGVEAAGVVSITTSIIQGNSTNGDGGGVLANGTTLTILDSLIDGNSSANNGGGVVVMTSGVGAEGSTITNTTITGNSALNNGNANNRGGGVDEANGGGGALLLLNDTINGNYAAIGGGVRWDGGGSISVENTIIAGNFGNTSGTDVFADANAFTDLGGNLIGVGGAGLTSATTQAGTAANPLNPLLGPLQYNGGPNVGSDGNTLPLLTEALLPGSPAIGRGLASGAPSQDARGLLRPSFFGAVAPDVGAFDTHALTPTVSSTVPGNGDVNPYGVFFVPAAFPTGGLLQPGDLLVANFNNADNTQGTGTTIVKITPGGQPTTFFTSQQQGLDDALAVLKAGFVVVGNIPNTDGMGTPGQGSLQFIDRNGNLVKTLTDANLLNGPWGLTVNDQGNTVQLYVSNALSGTVTRINLSIANGVVAVVSMTQIASGYTHGPNAAAFVLGPAGLAYDAAHDVLYVSAEGDEAIYKIANASTATDHGKGTLVVQDQTHLHGPLGLVFAPNGNLIVANSDGVNADPNQPSELVEYTTAGQFVAQFSVDPANGGAFGLGVETTAKGVKLAAVDDNANTISTWDFETGAVTGQVFQDLTGSGVKTANDPALGGITVNLVNPVTGAVLATTTTDGNGNYAFYNVAPGNYQVDLTAPSGFVQSTPNAVAVVDAAVAATPLGLYRFAAVNGNTLTITGTPQADTVTIQVGATDNILFNGGSFSVAGAGITTINFVGHGADTVNLVTGATPGTLGVSPGVAVVLEANLTINVTGAGKVLAFGGAAGDMAFLYDTSGQAVFVGTSQFSYLSAPGYLADVTGYSSVQAIARNGGGQAFLYDSPGANIFVGTPTNSYLQSTGLINDASGFKAVQAFDTAGNNDRAFLYDSGGSNTFVGTPGYSYLMGAGYFNEAVGFQQVFANSAAGANDSAFLYDGAGSNMFIGTVGNSYLFGAGYLNDAIGFKSVTAINIAGGNDTAQLFDSPGNDTFGANGNTGVMFTSTSNYGTVGFQKVQIVSSQGGFDQTFLTDLVFMLTETGPWHNHFATT